jgi:putative transposase
MDASNMCSIPPSDTQAALDRFAEFSEKWETRYPAIVRLWTSAWAEFVPFLQFDTEIRTIICTTNAIESINARIRRAVNARGHFPNDKPRSSASTWPS